MSLLSLVLVSLLYGPYQANIIRVVDATTLKLNVAVWPEQTNQITLTVADIESPRIKGVCETERLMAKEAKAFTNSFIGRKVILQKVQLSRKDGKYYAVVRNTRGDDLGQALIDAGYAVKKEDESRSSWCPDRN